MGKYKCLDSDMSLSADNPAIAMSRFVLGVYIQVPF
jgi:hypothetical protein